MKFTTGAVIGWIVTTTSSTTSAFVPATFVGRRSNSNRIALSSSTTTTTTSAEEAATNKPRTKKEARLNFMKSERFHRQGFKEVRNKVEDDVKGKFYSELVGELKESNYLIEKDGVKVYLAKVRTKGTGQFCCCCWRWHAVLQPEH